MSTFGLVIPGRLVDTNYQQVDQNKFLISIPNAESINHLVVFLTGLIPLPTDAVGCIFFSMPDPLAAPTWNYLGFLSNQKPSAIFKLSNMTSREMQQTNGYYGSATNELAFNYAQAPVNHVAQIGISIEPSSSVEHMVPATETMASKASTFEEFIKKTLNNLYNYCSSFGTSAQDLVDSINKENGAILANRVCSGNTQYVPLNKIRDWYENYTRRLEMDKNFWKNLS